ncbi:hypothetical protein CROQUDRAFT_71031 [Cronartium quercuum f. sp. fusiforme G11]|uniref:Uncharacterized protein n=1 Tax=Cronartium quercuum f. sp. fusiforme G11 TaxID=708437 RepID=A0A9P6THL0_9BASI|nr:hypothetical protein CROQUDRAFT_71031 [Cronartium quercuum f. sp. fusiforme G11]
MNFLGIHFSLFLCCLIPNSIASSSHQRVHRQLVSVVAPPFFLVPEVPVVVPPTAPLLVPSTAPLELTPNVPSPTTNLTQSSVNPSKLSYGLTMDQSSTSNGPIPRQLIYEVLTRSANHSWEWGTLAQYMLEEFYPTLSVYSPTQKIPLDQKSNLPYPTFLFDLIDPILQKRKPGIGPIIEDDAAGDPASLLIAVMVMGATVKKSPYGWDQAYYNQVAKDQIDFLVRMIRRTPDGAISQRVKELQLWNDFMFMAPPSMVYYGAATGDWLTLRLGYRQAEEYRKAMRDRSTKTWNHIRLGSWQDETLWSTGNAWSASGMIRMWATMNNMVDKSLREQTKPWRENLIEWTIEIVVGAFKFQSPTSGLLQNRYGNATFEEVSGTALLAASGYRVATYFPEKISRLPMNQIEHARTAILSHNVNRTTGIVFPVVDPFNWGSVLAPGVPSPEGQAFVLFMITAWESFVRSSQSERPPSPS